MKTTRILAAFAAAAAVAVPIAGCGGSDDQNFIDDYNSATKPLQDLGNSIGTQLNSAGGQSDKKVAAEFQKLADKTGEVNKNLDELDAPDDAKASFEDLKKALGQGQKDLQAIADAAKSGDIKAAQTAVQNLAKDSQAIQTSENAVKQKVEN